MARLLAILLLLAPLAGCVLPDELSQMQKDVADVQQQMKRVHDSQTALEEQVAELSHDEPDSEEEISRAEIADMQLRLEQISRQMSVSAERMNDVEQRLDGYSQELRRSRSMPRQSGPGSEPGLPPLGPGPPAVPPSVGSGNAAAGATPDPEALYNTAYADFSKGNYALAVSGFEEYQERFPQSALADNALYWIAECHFSQGDYTAAVDSLDSLLGRYPDSDKAPAANLKKALCFQEQNKIQQAIIQYRYVVSEYPQTDEARLARDKLGGLGASAD